MKVHLLVRKWDEAEVVVEVDAREWDKLKWQKKREELLVQLAEEKDNEQSLEFTSGGFELIDWEVIT